VQDSAEAPTPSIPTEGADSLGSLVLARVAVEAHGLVRTAVAADLAILAGQRPSAPLWRAAVDRAIETLAGAELLVVTPATLEASDAGMAAAADFLGVTGDLPRSWRQVCDLWLIARALRWPRTPAKRLAALETRDGLRAAVLTQAYGLQIKGVATPARLRKALSATALKRAFGEEAAGWIAGRLRLSARADRLLAAQLLTKPRDFGTDRGLVAALAAESIGAAASDLGSLRVAILRQLFGALEPPPRARRVRRKTSPSQDEALPPAPVKENPAPPAAVEGLPPAPAPCIPPTPQPLDLPRFASEVRRCAASEAQGWSGDRKAYISHVWRNVRETRPEWGLSEIEFKHLLAEAHRSGQLALANADLKDESNIKDVRDSAVVYRNAVFHFIRVEP
jgi:hypothetical protein